MVLLVQPKQKDDGFRIDLEAEVANVAETNYLRLYFDSSIGSSGALACDCVGFRFRVESGRRSLAFRIWIRHHRPRKEMQARPRG